MKYTKFKVIVIFMIILLILSQPLYSNAFSIDNIIEDGKSFEDAGTSSSGTIITDDELEPVSSMISNVLLTIAIAVTLISAIVMGINFAIQSVDDKAKIKESMIPWVIGIFISFGAYGIWQVTMKVFYAMM